MVEPKDKENHFPDLIRAVTVLAYQDNEAPLLRVKPDVMRQGMNDDDS